MDKNYLIKAFDVIIETYKDEASKYSECCAEDMLYAFEHLYNAQVHTLESIRQLIITDQISN